MKTGTLVKLGDVVTVVEGSVMPRPGQVYESYSVPSFDDGIPEVLDGGEIKSSKRPVKAGDVLVCKINPRINRVWKVQDNSGLEQIASTEWFALRCSNRVEPDFLVQALRAPSARRVIIESVSGATGSHTRARLPEVLELRIPLPSLDEQKRIAAKLDQVVAAERRLEDVAKTARSRCAQLRQQLTVDRMVGSGPLVELGELCEVLDSIRKPITKKDRTPGNIPYYGATGVVDYVTGYIFDEELVLLGEDGAKWGAGEKSAFAISGKAWVNNHAHVLRPKRERVRDQWLIEYLNAADLMDYVTGLTVPKLNQAQMRTIKVPTPTLRVQDEILDTLGGVYQATDHFEAVSTRRLCLSVNLRHSLLEAAFRGEL